MEPPATIGRFEVRGALGAGGMGEVLDAYDPGLSRRVALKLLGEAVREDPARAERFMREARAAAAIQHPNVVTIYEVGAEAEHGPYLAMERLESSLRPRLAGPLPLESAIAIARDVASGLAAAHAAGLVHRDLKPENILFDGEGRAKVADFGLAKSIALHDEESAAVADTQEVLTADGVVLGSPGYLAPEQARGAPIDRRADVFAFGVILYEMLAGRRAFRDTQPVALLVAVVSEEPEPLSELRPDLPEWIITLVECCLAKRALDRPADGSALVEALQTASWPDGAPVAVVSPQRAQAARPAPSASTHESGAKRGWIAGLLVVLVALAALGVGAATVSLDEHPETEGPDGEAPEPEAPGGIDAADLPAWSTCEARECPDDGRAFCDREGAQRACCPRGLVPASEDRCVCPPGGVSEESVTDCPRGEGNYSAEIARVISSERSRLSACLGEHVLSGELMLSIDLTASGEVFEASLVRTSIRQVDVQQCILREVRGLRFPPPTGGGVSMHYPLILRRGRGPRVMPCKRDSANCRSPDVLWCDEHSESVACCAAGLVPAPGDDGICACPPGGAINASPDGCDVEVDAEDFSVRMGRVLTAAAPQYGLCFDDTPPPQTLTLTLTPSGDVISATPDPGRCVRNWADRLRFDPPPGGIAEYTVSLPP